MTAAQPSIAGALDQRDDVRGEIVVSEIEPGDSDVLSLILDSWCRSYQGLMPQYANAHGSSRWDWTRHCAERVLSRGARLVSVTVDTLPDAVLGWACAEPQYPQLHYVYVKHAVRRHGLAKLLISAALAEPNRIGWPHRVRMTHRPGKKLREQSHKLGWHYQPLTPEEL